MFDQDFNLKIIDFGLAVVKNSENIKIYAGSRGYMAP